MTGFSKHSKFPEFILILFFCALILSAPNSYAEERQQRLSEWLSSRVIAAEDYPLGLVWQVPDEEPAQARMKSELLSAISGGSGDAEAKRRLYDLITEMPVTGRVPVSIADADWLRANPNHDPVIGIGHRVILPKRPHTVTLLTSSGARCQFPHMAAGRAVDYLRGCMGGDARQVDWAWVVQPDGKVSRFGTALWNSQKQEVIAPGATIWMAFRNDRWAEDISPKLAAFLATQGIVSKSAIASDKSALSNLVVSESFGIERYDDPVVTANDWGGAGLLQSPTARMRPASHGSMTYSGTYPYSRINIFLQPMDWMEVGFRYTNISNRMYGPLSFSGTQTYKDKSIDVKVGLLDESAYLPQVALGLRDVAGTGFFSSEFLVANKRVGSFDWSLGLGWGYVAGRGDMNNPLGFLNSSFNEPREINYSVSQAGQFSSNGYFHGPTALFGGVQYQSPWEPLILKLEYDGNDYQHEPQRNNQKQSSPLNFGAVYRLGDALDVTFGIERGNTFMFGITMHSELRKMVTPKLDDPARVPVAAVRPQRSAVGDVTVRDLESQTGWSVRSIKQDSRDLSVVVDDVDVMYWRERTDRASAVLHRDASPEIDRFNVLYRQRGVDLVEQSVDRDAWVNQQVQPSPPGKQIDSVVIRGIEQGGSADKKPETLYQGTPPVFRFEPGFNLKYSLGGPDGFILYQLTAEGRAKAHLNDDTWLQGNLQFGLIDNYDNFKVTTSSELPRVRTYVREYLTTSKVTMPTLQLTHAGKLTANQYFSVYAGYLESMFAGTGGEWLYRPLGSQVALGVDMNRVQQRDFNQDFSLRTYQANTGHATLYWDTGWSDVFAKVSAGRYLAGDVGVTVDMSRVYQNGVRMGAFFTKTNVSSEQFGEGSFDKGIYVIIPFDAMMTKSGSSIGTFLWRPLTRDGGAKLSREVQLYDMTKLLDQRAMQYRPAELDNNIPIPSQKPAQWGVGIN